MFTYCNNNPAAMVDEEGNFGLIASMLIGGVVGIASQFVCGVVDNMMSGKTGVDVFSNTGTVGEYIAAFAGGALCSIPGASSFVSVVCDIAMPAVQQSIDCVVYHTKWDTGKYLRDVSANVICDLAASTIAMDSPRFIRDIKDEARAAGYKGTKQLTSYLKHAQNIAFAGNQLIGSLTSIASTVYSFAGQKMIHEMRMMF